MNKLKEYVKNITEAITDQDAKFDEKFEKSTALDTPGQIESRNT